MKINSAYTPVLQGLIFFRADQNFSWLGSVGRTDHSGLFQFIQETGRPGITHAQLSLQKRSRGLAGVNNRLLGILKIIILFVIFFRKSSGRNPFYFLLLGYLF